MTSNVITEGITVPNNSAAWLPSARSSLRVGPAPYTAPGPDQIVVRNRAIAVNPVDSVKQKTGNLMYSWLAYPFILGEDVAGEVVEVGSAVSRFRVGDRVLAYAVGMEKARNRAAEGAFQLYSVVLAKLATPIPASIAFAEAAVLPLAVSTAASALFQRDQLALAHPGLGASTGEAVLIWGGSTSVGSSAIQLAVAAGYRVVTTASPHNFAYVTQLGASGVVDYRSDRAIDDVIEALDGMPLAGVLAVGTGSAEPAVAIAARAAGARRVVMASPSVSLDSLPEGGFRNPRFIAAMSRFVGSAVALQISTRVRRVKATFVWGSSLMNNEVSEVLFEQFLPQALADGRFVPAPAPLVVGSGLEHVHTALDRLREGVSAQKVVVELP